jgi:hypothetical protein
VLCLLALERANPYKSGAPGRRGGARGYGWYGRGMTLGDVPSTQTGLPCEVMVTLELVSPGAVASISVVPE